MMNIFELKYLIVDNFYEEVSVNKYTFEQAIGITYYAFTEYIQNGGLECLVTLTNILKLAIRHNVKITENDIEKMKQVLDLADELDLLELLDENELEYVEGDISVVRYWYVHLDEYDGKNC